MIFDEIIDGHYSSKEYPALFALQREWSCTRPFLGVRVLVATPIFRNTITEYRALIAGGAELYVGRASGGVESDGVCESDGACESDSAQASMPCDESVVKFLQENGIEVLTPQDVLAAEAEGEFVDVILDCAGQFSACHPRYGFVELTRSGVQFFEKCPLPVYVADSGIVKRIETSLGTGEGCVRALASLGYGDLDGKTFTVFGGGKVGCGIVLQLLRSGACVRVVTDVSAGVNGFLLSNGVLVTDCHDTEAVAALVRDSEFVVTATGIKGALDVPGITAALLDSKAVLANMGVEDEYGAGVHAGRVLAEKKPLNFVLEEPTHLKYIDASLALHAALGERLLQDAMCGANGDSADRELNAADCANGGVADRELNAAGCANGAAAGDLAGRVGAGPQNPPEELEQRILLTTIQDGLIGTEINAMLGGLPAD